MLAGNGRAGLIPGQPLNDGMPPAGPDVRFGEGVELGGRDARLDRPRMRSRTSPTTRPARAMRSISARDLRVTMVRPARGVAQGIERAGQVGGDRLDAGPPVDRRQDAGLAVVVDDLEERRDLLGHPGPHGHFVVVRSLDDRGTVVRTEAVGRRRVGDHVVDMTVGLADPAVGHALDEVFDRDVDVQRVGDAAAGGRPGPRRGPRPARASAGSRRGSRRRPRRVRRGARGRRARSCRPGRAVPGACSGRPPDRAGCPAATALRSRSPDARIGIPSRRASAGACVPLPAPGAPGRTTTVTG